MFKTKKTRIEPDAGEKTFTSSDISTIAGVSLRQLQWWDEQKVVSPRHEGHNPLGGWMIVALLATVAGLALSGWLYTSDAFWGDATVEAWHRGLAWTLLVLVLLHLAGVVHASRRHRENLVRAMLSGDKRESAPGDVL